MIYLELFVEFFITGALIFGGGLAAIPFLNQMGYRTGWFTTKELMDMVAISEATPGPVGINVSTFAGYTVAGIPGGIVASIGLVLPSIIISLIVARLMVQFRKSKYVESALYGLRSASLGLIAAAGIAVFFLVMFGAELRNITGEHIMSVNYRALILAAFLFVATNKVKIHPIIFLAFSAVVGILFL